MPIISVRIPQLGEGLQEALLIEFLKKPGDKIKRDEPIYTMETDKATTDVESPYEGTLVEWTVKTGSVLSIGTEIAKMEVAEGVKEMPAGHGPVGHSPSPHGDAGADKPASSSTKDLSAGHAVSTESNGSFESSPGISANDQLNEAVKILAGSSVGSQTLEPAAKASSLQTLHAATQAKPGRAIRRAKITIPPRTRKYLKEKGLIDVCDEIPAAGSKLMPADVDKYLLAIAGGKKPTLVTESDLPQSQIVLNYRLGRGAKVVVPVTVISEIDWVRIDTARQLTRDANGPTGFTMACWCVAQALKKHAKFRSIIINEGRSLKTFQSVNLGIAVALPGDEMVTAVVHNAGEMSQHEFFIKVNERITLARNGKDQADETTTLTVSNIGKAGMRIGIPAVVAPAVATLALGEVFDRPVPDGDKFKFRKAVMATLSFDHRVINGVGAGNFLSDVRQMIENFSFVI
ncbi:MAG TPA: 2-oxo acid dehydrogenase subunit E2 [Pirellulaceae bacterium]|nr:2-oxo acid dehydrogenase subunit E2 [Pirellulaceae bacterium]HMO93277.1 2-oxo acid dehydrogenase subunit E2 [Pirellulaceae bacterium]HMP70183.1 2-oxo acid dehydrogenase subunit E2 [Pirellulaceae bacterium]